MKINCFEKDKSKYPNFNKFLKFPTTDEVRPGLKVCDSFSRYRNENASGLSMSLLRRDHLRRFKTELAVSSELKKSSGNELIQPLNDVDFVLLEKGYNLQYLDEDVVNFDLKEMDGIILTTVKNCFLVVNIDEHKNNETNVSFRDGIGVFYPRSNYSYETTYVPSMLDVLVYLDFIGVDRSKCSFTYFDFSIIEPDINKMKVDAYEGNIYSSGSHSNWNIRKEGGIMTFNSFENYKDCLREKPLMGKSWVESIGKDVDDVFEQYKPDCSSNVEKLSVVISF